MGVICQCCKCVGLLVGDGCDVCTRRCAQRMEGGGVDVPGRVLPCGFRGNFTCCL